MSGTGPIEEGAYDPATRPTEVIAAGPPPRRPRPLLRAALAVGAAALALTAALSHAQHTPSPRPQPEPAPLPPRPTGVTSLTYAGTAGPPDPRSHTFTFRIRATLTQGPPTTLEQLSQPYDELTMTLEPAAPVVLHSGKTRSILLTITAHRCTGLPLDTELPYLNVTLRNMRAIENPSYILGATYAADLTKSLRAICPQTVR
ncbi:Tat pathway signal sequence domain protein [Streptomyces sp. NBC_01465]|uniref:Tat pathway signal sequence domain protein n=1 Tax=Streptomyces sp. NBC_01465 TaxID=2903878 RepID=UPI002E2F610D|nr:Tat pathway signal sequence domain protein [Streptomyces sp. NBC_01465]